jgi:hypothetical protein
VTRTELREASLDLLSCTLARLLLFNHLDCAASFLHKRLHVILSRFVGVLREFWKSSQKVFNVDIMVVDDFR